MTKARLYSIIFKTDTKAGKRFDVVLLWLILFSVFVVMMESIPEYGRSHEKYFKVIEFVFTALFTIEYIVRIAVSRRPLRYMLSFWGVIDLLSIVPTYLSLVFTGYHYLLIVRIFRLLRVFRIFKLGRFNSESKMLVNALRASSHKISVFFISVVSIVTLLGTLMYVIEGGEKGFTSIPQSIYWAIVTITTVGYGDMVPQTVLGKFVSSFVMILGYAIIAVPTGIVTMELSRTVGIPKECDVCRTKNEMDAVYCKACGNEILSMDSD